MKSLEDEDALVWQIDENIKTADKAVKVMDELEKEEQNFKKFKKYLAAARASAHEHKHLLQQNASVDRLPEKSSMIFAWEKVSNLFRVCPCDHSVSFIINFL